MKRKLLIGILGFAMLAGTTYAASPNIVSVLVNGKKVQDGTIIGNSTMLPLRAVAEALEADVVWDNAKKQAIITTSQQAVQPVQQPPAAKSGLSLEQLNKIGENVGEVYPLDSGGNFVGQGSGFLLGGGVFVTNNHVGSVGVKLRIDLNGKSYMTDSKPLFSDEKLDLYAVKIDAVGGVKISAELPKEKEHLYTVGFPNGKFTLAEGYVAYISTMSGFDEIVHTAKEDRGSSGGILVSDKGEVIGVTKSGNDAGTANFSIPIKYVQELNK